MAKKGIIEREKKRSNLVKKFAEKRAKYKQIISLKPVKKGKDQKLDADEELIRLELIYKARLDLQQLPRNANPTRQRNRCVITGRARGTYQMFGLGRSKLREFALRGEIPGLTKASW